MRNSIFIVSFLYSIFLFSCNNNSNINKQDNLRKDWLNFTDTAYNFSVQYPNNFIPDYVYIFHRIRTFHPDSTSRMRWNVDRFHSSYNHSRVQKMIEDYDSTQIIINGKEIIQYVYNKPNRQYYNIAKAVQYKYGDFIFEITTYIENDSLFDLFHQTLEVDTAGLRKSYESFAIEMDKCLEEPEISALKDLNIKYEVQGELQSFRETKLIINGNGYNKDLYYIHPKIIRNANTSNTPPSMEFVITPNSSDSVCIVLGFSSINWGIGITVDEKCFYVKN